MKEFFDYLFNSWVNYLLFILTLSLLWSGFIAGIRILVETSIPIMFQKCVERYVIVETAIKKVNDDLNKE